MYLNQSPLRSERDLVFVRLLGNAMAQFAEAAAHTEGLEEFRKLVWWNLAPVAPFALWVFVIQQLCRNIVNLLGKSPALLFTAKYLLTRDPRLPKWQHNPSWNQFLSGPHKNGNNEEYISVLTVEYSFCLTTAIGIFEAFVKQDIANGWLSETHRSEDTKPSVSAGTPHQASWDIHFAFGDPQVTILNSPGIFIFEACTSAIETSYALMDQYPQAADKAQEAFANTLMVTGALDRYSRRLEAVMDRIERTGKGERREGTSQLRATAQEFCPTVREANPRPGPSVFSSAVHAPVFVPRVYSSSRPLALRIDDFEMVYGQS